MIKITEFSHTFFLDEDFHDEILIDMTAGGGRDTLFLASIARKVYAFDIQKSAIDSTRRLLDEHSIDNVVLINGDHSCVDEHVTEVIGGAIYNLGYLPQGDKAIRTQKETTIASLKKLFRLLKRGGIIVIVSYEKDDARESIGLQEYLSSLPSREYDVMKHALINKKLSPYVITIRKLT